ncbi:MAG: sensor histidine kinase [Chitinophagaceae bacterium]
MRNASFFLRYKLHHLFFWMLIYGVWYYLRADDYARPSMAARVTGIKVLDLALMIYITNYFLIPRFLYRKKYWIFAGLLLGMVFASSIFKMILLGRITYNPLLVYWWVDFKSRVYDNIIPHLFLVIAGAAGKLVYDYRSLQQRMAETAKEKAEAELKFLKSQINPHFVFNSLNAVYFLIHKENTEARSALHKFSEMLRYQLYEMNGRQVTVEKEVRYLQDYVDLQQLRQDEKYRVQFTCSDSVKGFTIEPLLLIPLVENAFKHISHHPDKTNFVEISLDRQNGSFLFSVKNSREMTQSKSPDGGIGLQNVKRRLELLYPGRHELTIKDTSAEFSVHLNLNVS